MRMGDDTKNRTKLSLLQMLIFQRTQHERAAQNPCDFVTITEKRNRIKINLKNKTFFFGRSYSLFLPLKMLFYTNNHFFIGSFFEVRLYKKNLLYWSGFQQSIGDAHKKIIQKLARAMCF